MITQCSHKGETYWNNHRLSGIPIYGLNGLRKITPPTFQWSMPLYLFHSTPIRKCRKWLNLIVMFAIHLHDIRWLLWNSTINESWLETSIHNALVRQSSRKLITKVAETFRTYTANTVICIRVFLAYEKLCIHTIILLLRNAQRTVNRLRLTWFTTIRCEFAKRHAV